MLAVPQQIYPCKLRAGKSLGPMVRHYAKLLRATLTALLMLVALAGAAVAGPFEDGGAAFVRGDYATAMRLWRPLAEQGDALAQSNLGQMYSKGQGAPQDYAAAASWYRKAAEQGVDTAQTNLGRMYDIGQGVPQDYATAIRWYRKAAEQGDAFAQYNLGIMYANGRGGPKTMRLPWSGIEGRPIRVSPMRNLISVTCTTAGLVSRKTMLWLTCGST
jgi:TPR repeat protein